MAEPAAAARLPRRGTVPGSSALGRGVVTAYLSVIVLVPLAAVAWKATGNGWEGFWNAITSPGAIAALKLTFFASVAVALVNAVMDLPFALPTIVAGLTLLALYGPRGPVGVNVAYTRWAIILALLFVTVPFVIRSVQPVLLELDPEMEEAAASLGAGPFTCFRRVILPNLMPAILSGVALAFARA